MLQDLKELQSSNSRLSEQLKMKDEEIDRLRRQLLDTSNYVLPPSSPPDHEVSIDRCVSVCIIWSLYVYVVSVAGNVIST